MRRPIRTLAAAFAAATMALVAAACGDDAGGGSTASASTASSAATSATTPGGTVRLVTHESFALSDEVLASFKSTTGYDLEVIKGGDAGSIVNQAILTKGNPQADVLYGIDNTLLSRAVDAGLFVELEPDPARDAALDPALDGGTTVVPVDYSDVCINYDKRRFDGPGQLAAPTSLDDLRAPEYAAELVMPDPATSSPGLAFLLATVARYGEAGYGSFWDDLQRRGAHATAGWSEAFYDHFSAGGGDGQRSLVVSYRTSPPVDVAYATEPKEDTDIAVMVDGCFRQVEYAGILAGTNRTAGAQALIDFLVSPAVQADLPMQMFVFPARTDVTLPEEFSRYVPEVSQALSLDPVVIAEGREGWIKTWTDLFDR